MITFENFYTNTFAVFKSCKEPKRLPDYISKSESKYWYGNNKKGNYIIRKSDHWVKHTIFSKSQVDYCKSVSSCKWVLKLRYGINMRENLYNEYCGKAYLSDFKII